MSVIWAVTEAMGPTRCSSMSRPWHCVSIRFACGWVPKLGSPPKRQVAKTISPRRPSSIAALARWTASA